MLFGLGILANSLLYVAIILPAFLFIYQSIVLAEEDFLRQKFGTDFDDYCKKVPRWFPKLKGIGKTFKSMRFNWKRWVLKENTTQFIWLVGIAVLLLLKYPAFTGNDETLRNILLGIIPGCLLLVYLFVRYLKKRGKFKE